MGEGDRLGCKTRTTLIEAQLKKCWIPTNLIFITDDDVFIELSLPNKGVLCGYKNGSSTAVAIPCDIIYLMHMYK